MSAVPSARILVACHLPMEPRALAEALVAAGLDELGGFGPAGDLRSWLVLRPADRLPRLNLSQVCLLVVDAEWRVLVERELQRQGVDLSRSGMLLLRPPPDDEADREDLLGEERGRFRASAPGEGTLPRWRDVAYLDDPAEAIAQRLVGLLQEVRFGDPQGLLWILDDDPRRFGPQGVWGSLVKAARGAGRPTLCTLLNMPDAMPALTRLKTEVVLPALRAGGALTVVSDNTVPFDASFGIRWTEMVSGLVPSAVAYVATARSLGVVASPVRELVLPADPDSAALPAARIEEILQATPSAPSIGGGPAPLGLALDRAAASSRALVLSSDALWPRLGRRAFGAASSRGLFAKIHQRVMKLADQDVAALAEAAAAWLVGGGEVAFAPEAVCWEEVRAWLERQLGAPPAEAELRRWVEALVPADREGPGAAAAPGITPPAGAYDVALSYSSADVAVAEALAVALRALGVRVFYDRFDTASLWGHPLFESLYRIYSRRCRCAVPLVSRAYLSGPWTRQESEWLRIRRMREEGRFLFPVSLDGSQLLGLDDLHHRIVPPGGVTALAEDLKAELAKDLEAAPAV